ncbi:MAG: TPM domain-containing protein [Flavobacteriales bacterium]
MKFPLGKIILLFFLLLVFSMPAQDCIPEKPESYPFMVYDNTHSLSSQEVQMLEGELEKFSRETSNQIVVVFLNDLCGYSAADLGTELGQRWRVGKEKEDNGVVILIKPTGEKKERTAAIAIGRGLEPVISDGTAGSIVRDEMIPEFKKGNYFQGVVNALNIIEPLAKKEFNQADYANKQTPGWGIVLLVVLAIIFIVGFKTVQARSYAHMNHTSFWTALMLTSFMNRGRGSWNDFHSGRGGFGGGDSGFGGFGGGSFGGGGAESSW